VHVEADSNCKGHLGAAHRVGAHKAEQLCTGTEQR
jgi:hypothetical protein